MFVSPDYLEHYAVQVTSEPVTTPVSGIEQPSPVVIGTDDPDGTTVAINYLDEYPDNQPWSLKKGVAKRATFVRLLRGGKSYDGLLYRFEGLIRPADLRAWYRTKIGLDVATELPAA